MNVGTFFGKIGHIFKVVLGNPTALRLEAGVIGIAFPGLGGLANSAANALIAAEGTAAAAGVQNGTGLQKFAYALSQFGPVYDAWAAANNVTITDEHKKVFLQKIFDILQFAPEIASILPSTNPVGPTPVLPGTPTT